MVQLVIPFTRGGVSCLTPQQVENLVASTSVNANDNVIFSFSIFDAIGATKACEKLTIGYAPFCGYKNTDKYKTIMTIRPAAIGPHNAGPSTENAVVGECESGRVSVDMKTLIKSVNAFKPTWCLPLYAPINVEEFPPTKKARTAGMRTAKWFGAAMGSSEPKGMVAVPSSLVASAAAEELSMCPLTFLDCAGQGETLGTRTAAVQNMVCSVKATSNSDGAESDDATTSSSKPTFVIAESIPALLLAALAGASLVECDYASACAKRGQSIDLSPVIAVLKGEDTNLSVSSSTYPFVIDLNDQKYQLDTTPFTPASSSAVAACPCYSCRRHTKAYVYHLLSVQEMNSETILMIHNLSQVMQVCDALQSTKGTPSVQKERIEKALKLLSP